MADFGMCRATAVYKVDLSKPLNVRWLAPEVWTNGETRYNTDVYAFGVMIWEFFITPYQSPYTEWKGYTVKVLSFQKKIIIILSSFSKKFEVATGCNRRRACRKTWHLCLPSAGTTIRRRDRTLRNSRRSWRI